MWKVFQDRYKVGINPDKKGTRLLVGSGDELPEPADDFFPDNGN
jgi:hypothetical protein